MRNAVTTTEAAARQVSESNGASSAAPSTPTIEITDARLPVQGTTLVPMSAESLWTYFADVRSWPKWNPCMFVSRVTGGELRVGSYLVWAFNPIEPRYLYRMPALARIVTCQPARKVTWEVSLPGFHALHSYTFEPIDGSTCRFGSWEVAEGPMYRALRPFWLAHFEYVRDASLAGAEKLGQRA